MSLPGNEIYCDKCDYKSAIFFRPIKIIYKTKTGEELSGYTERGWCYDCDNKVRIEYIERNGLNTKIENANIERNKLVEQLELLLSLTRFFKKEKDETKIKKINSDIFSLKQNIKDYKKKLTIAQVRKST